MRHLAITLVLLATAVVATGCANEDYFCEADGCYYCDGLGCRQVDPPERPECRGDFECPDGASCTDMGCIETCEDDADCREGTVCRKDLPTGPMCLAPNEPDPQPTPGDCERNEDCGDPGLVCRDGVCTPDDRTCGETGCSCEATGECADGFSCIDGECRPDDEVCRFSHECGEGRVCIDGECAESCNGDAGCPTGQMCEEGICRDVPPPTGECVDNADCGDGGVCIDSTCYDACSMDDDCGDGRYCDGGVCRIDDRPKPFCEGDADCSAGHPCISGVCRTPCSVHEDCLRFDVQFNYCLDGFCATTNEATSDCSVSEDCGSGQECIDGICQ